MLALKKISINRRLFHRKGSGWSDIKYYVPFYVRPVVPVTIGLLDQVEPLETDKPTIKECKSKLYKELSQCLGYDILQDSPHLYSGLIMRNIIYVGTSVYFLPVDMIEFVIMIPTFTLLVMLPYSMIVLDNADLHKRFTCLTKK
jgi:hypothetical protein